jgi:hypothetical protein
MLAAHGHFSPSDGMITNACISISTTTITYLHTPWSQSNIPTILIKIQAKILKKYLGYNSPMTDLANDRFLRVARPRSPILTLPVVPVMKILSHFRSRCIIGGVLECKKLKPFRICRHQDFRTLGLIFLNLLRYLQEIQDTYSHILQHIQLSLQIKTTNYKCWLIQKFQQFKITEFRFLRNIHSNPK